ncbi:MAG TPA: amino acid permease [Solirubrobacteraceae bacterium]|jgi:amino acid transporter|nr:amino acid permease [Solirubrobacteraceae bacterium]
MTDEQALDRDEQTLDEQTLAQLGYRQELSRAWSGFTNFAISFTIISVLAGTFTTFAFAWQNGGPIAASIGWPVLCAFVLMVALSMAELTSRYPTAGGPYWWAFDLGGKGWSWMTGWFNIVGLVGIVASVAYGCAFFLFNTLQLYGLNVLGVNFGDTKHILSETFLLYLIILALYTLVNIFADRILALMNNISVGWHLVGVAIIIAVLVFVPAHHQSASFVFGERINNNGFFGGSTSSLGFWFFVLPTGFLLAMYTQTGYDASAHTAEETRGAAKAAAQGVWRSVFWSALIGWFVLLAFLFAATDVKAVNDGAGFVGAIFTSVLPGWAAKLIFVIATVGQFFCGAAGLTSASRTWYAFSRDRGMPGWGIFRRVNRDRVPFNAVIAVSVASLVIAIPALFGKNNIPFAFFALTGICTVGLYLAYIIPVYLRLRQGDAFQPGPWNLGRRYRIVNILAIIFVIVVVYALDLPYTPTGLPWNPKFDASLVNYTPFAILLPLIFGIWYLISAKDRYQGPVRTLEEDEVTAV